LPLERFEIDLEKLQRIIKESFSVGFCFSFNIIPYKEDSRFLIDIVCEDWLGVYFHELNGFANRLCNEEIIKRASKDFFVFNVEKMSQEKKDYVSLGIMLDVTDTWYRSLRPKPKTRITPKIFTPKIEPKIFIDEGNLGISKEERIQQIIRQRKLREEG